MTVSASFIENRQRVNDAGGLLELLTITHSSFTEPLYLVNDTRNWEISGITYTGFPFRFTYPQDKAKESPRSTLEIDNVGRDLTSELELLPSSAILMATVSLVERPNLHEPTLSLDFITETYYMLEYTVEWSWTVPMTNVSVNAAVISATLGVDFLMRQQAVRLRHDPNTSPGIFED